MILTRLIADLGEQTVVEVMPKMEGRQITMVLAPGKIAKQVATPTEEEAAIEAAPESIEVIEPAADIETPPEDEESAEPASADEE